MRILLTTILLSIATVSAAETDKTWMFDVYLDDKQMGTHSFEVENDGERTILTTEASFKVNFLFFTAFEYEHRSREIWRDGCLEEIDAKTDNNGTMLNVEGEKNESGFEIESTKGGMSLEGCVRTFAYWKPAILEAERLLNPQTGTYEDVSVEKDGEETLTVDGQDVLTERYRLKAEKGDILLWYTKDEQRWVALNGPAKGDRRIRYEATNVPGLSATKVARSN